MTKPVISKDKYETEYIPVKNLSVVWVQCQRPYNDKWAREIADNFDPDKFEPLVVTKPNGQGIYHIIEGQHRRHALEMYSAKVPNSIPENELCPCRVVDNADPARAAEIWLGINAGRKTVKPLHGFQVSVIAGREPEVTINRIVQRAGYRVTSAKVEDGLTAVSALKTIYNRHSRDTLENTLATVRNLWGSDPAAVSSPMLRGFALFIHEFSEHLDLKRLQAKIGARFSPWKFKEAANARKTSTLEKLDEAIAELLFREYNHGSKSKLKRKSS